MGGGGGGGVWPWYLGLPSTIFDARGITKGRNPTVPCTSDVEKRSAWLTNWNTWELFAGRSQEQWVMGEDPCIPLSSYAK